MSRTLRDSARWRTGFIGFFRRTLLSGILSALVVMMGTVAMFVTEWPKWLSLTVEPLSLTLMPGVVLSMIFTLAHDYTPREVLEGAYVCYLAAFYLLLWTRDRMKRRRLMSRV